MVSIHSRLKAAVIAFAELHLCGGVSIHSRLKAAERQTEPIRTPSLVSIHSRLKAAENQKGKGNRNGYSFNTQPPEGGWQAYHQQSFLLLVSIHSRLKAAECAAKVTAFVCQFQYTAA